jgi:hypothetical protein
MPAQHNATYHARRLHCLVVDLGEDHDIILGQNWMRTERAVISFPDQTCFIQKKDLVLECIKTTPSSNDSCSIPRITAIRAKREIQKGARCLHVRVFHTMDGEQTPTPPPPREQSEYGLTEKTCQTTNRKQYAAYSWNTTQFSTNPPDFHPSERFHT